MFAVQLLHKATDQEPGQASTAEGSQMRVHHLGVHSQGCALLSHQGIHRGQAGAEPRPLLKLGLSRLQFLGRLTPAAAALEELVQRVNAACWVGSDRRAAGSRAGPSASPAAAAGRAAGGCV